MSFSSVSVSLSPQQMIESRCCSSSRMYQSRRSRLKKNWSSVSVSSRKDDDGNLQPVLKRRGGDAGFASSCVFLHEEEEVKEEEAEWEKRFWCSRERGDIVLGRRREE